MIRPTDSDIIIHGKKVMFYTEALSLLPHLNAVTLLTCDKNIISKILEDDNQSKLGVYIIVYVEGGELKTILSNMSCAIDICNSHNYLVVGVYDYRSLLHIPNLSLNHCASLPESEQATVVKAHLLSYTLNDSSAGQQHKEKFIGLN